jgi:hypothetical protein
MARAVSHGFICRRTRYHLPGIVDGRIGLRCSRRATIRSRSTEHVSYLLQRAIRQAAPRRRHTSGFQITHYPATLFSPIPKVVREIGAQDPVQQIVELLVLPAFELGDIDPDLLFNLEREFEGWLPAF